MLFSTTLLKNSIEKFQKQRKEKFTEGQAVNAGFTGAFVSFTLVLSLMFFVLEVILLFFAINTAISCTEGGYERIVHVVLAFTFTLPYVLINVFFSNCAKKILKSNSKNSLTLT
jgi:hypothetical protein